MGEGDDESVDIGFVELSPGRADDRATTSGISAMAVAGVLLAVWLLAAGVTTDLYASRSNDRAAPLRVEGTTTTSPSTTIVVSSEAVTTTTTRAPDVDPEDADSDEPRSLLVGLILVLVALGLVALSVVVIVAVLRALRARRDPDPDQSGGVVHDVEYGSAPEPEPGPEPELVEAEIRALAAAQVHTLDELLADLRHDTEPARAIQRAYATLETGMGNPGLARRRTETCATYLARTIGVVDGVDEPLRTLTTNFELARFSTATITESMRGDAVDALIAIRRAWQRQADGGVVLATTFEGPDR